ncbi:MAG: hypothetical protein IKY16_01665, partial [Bacteroidales bacterium]|nr:hypothetical protein [Bacteroidales bacterium]
TTEQAAAIKALENEIAALETALATAQKAADDAKAAANDAKAAAAQATADAIADAKAQVEALKTALETAIAEKADKAEVDAMAKDVEAALAVINTKIAELAGKDAILDGKIAELLQADEALKAQIAALQAYGKDSSDSLVVELSALQNELDQLWQTIGSETGLQALVGTQAGLIEDLQAELQGLSESIFGEGAESLYTLVGQNAGMIQELLDKMDKVNADIEAINEALSVYNALLEEYGKQIQAVVYVPENTLGTTVASSYVLGQYKSDVLVKLTYEVTPNELAAEVTTDKVYFNAVPVTKAEAAEVIAAEVVDTDANTGRVVVYARVKPANKATYKALTEGQKNVQLSLNIADHKLVSLPGEDDKTVDAGTVVAADYVPVISEAENLNQNVLDLVKFYNTKKNEWVLASETNTVSVPYTEPAAQSLFNIYDVRVDVEGQAMTPAEASAFIGTAINVTYATADFSYTDKNGNGLAYPAQKDFIPFATVKNGLASTAQVVAPAKVQLNQTVGYKAATTVSTLKVNNTPATSNVALTGELVIDYAKAAITFATYDAGKWSYNTPERAQEWIAVERAVTSPVDITKLTYMGAPVLGQDIELTAYAKTKDAQGKDTKVEGYANVKVLSSKAAQVTYVNVPFLTHDALYEARFQLIDPATNVAYDVAFDITLGAKPTDKKIDLGTFTANAALTHSVEIPVGEAAAKILATDATFFADFVLDYQKMYYDPVYVATEFAMSSAIKSQPAGAALTLAYNAQTKKEASYITVDPQAKFDATYALEHTYNFFGVNYTFTAKVNFQKPNYSIAPNPVLVKNGVVTLDGTVTIPELNSKKLGLTEGKAYDLNVVKLSQYIVVSDAVKAEVEAGELAIVYMFTDTYDDDRNPMSPAVPVPGVSIDGEVIDVVGEVIVNGEALVSWDGANRKNALNFVVALVHATATDAKGQNVVFNTVPVQTVVPELVKLEAPASKVVTVAYKNGAEATTANIVGALVVKDVKTGKEIYNKYAADLTEIWEGYSRAKTTDAFASTGVNVFDVYNQTIAVDKKNVKAYLETSNYALTAADYSVDATTGTVTLLMDNGNLTENVIVEVPVILTHDYCGTPHTAVAKVKFTK